MLSSPSSQSPTCLDLLFCSYRNTIDFVVTRRPFGMRIADMRVKIVRKGGEAHRLGIAPNDRLLQIDGKPVDRKSWNRAFATKPCPFTISMERLVYPGDSVATPLVSHRSYDDTQYMPCKSESTTSARTPVEVPERGRPSPSLHLPFLSHYSASDILAGRLHREKSPTKARERAEAKERAGTPVEGRLILTAQEEKKVTPKEAPWIVDHKMILPTYAATTSWPGLWKRSISWAGARMPTAPSK